MSFLLFQVLQQKAPAIQSKKMYTFAAKDHTLILSWRSRYQNIFLKNYFGKEGEQGLEDKF